MNAPHCCHSSTGNHNKTPRSASPWRRGVGIAEWIIPSATLILMPKCPVCVAMYLALFAGAGISVTSASNLRTALLILCVTALVCLAVKHFGRLVFQKKRSRGIP
jgi:hypothetical protein